MANLCRGEFYACVRKDADGEEFFDHETFARTMTTSREKARQIDANAPRWAEMNPVVRLCEVTVKEVRL